MKRGAPAPRGNEPQRVLKPWQTRADKKWLTQLHNAVHCPFGAGQQLPIHQTQDALNVASQTGIRDLTEHLQQQPLFGLDVVAMRNVQPAVQGFPKVVIHNDLLQ
jgi:hypothetical protein